LPSSARGMDPDGPARGTDAFARGEKARETRARGVGAGQRGIRGAIPLPGLRGDGLPLAAAGVFLVLLAPSIIGFQERYLFLPLAASSLLLASLLRSIGGRPAGVLTALILAGWTWGCIRHWGDWREASLASRSLVAGLVEASRRPDVDEIVVANAPFRVRGGSVAGDFGAAIRLSGGAPTRVRVLAFVSYPRADLPLAASEPANGETRVARDARRGIGSGEPPTAGTPPQSSEPSAADRLESDRFSIRRSLDEGEPRASIRLAPGAAEVRLRVREGPFSHFVSPRPGGASAAVEIPAGTAVFEDAESLLIKVPARKGTAGYAWIGGRLEPL